MTSPDRTSPNRASASPSEPRTLPESVGQRTEAGPVPLLAPPAVAGAAGYAIGRELGRGGMGTVYAAYDPTLDREVAVKVMHPGGDGGRFVTESKVTAKLTHPGVPPVYALGALPDGRPYLAMKLVEGRTLSARLEDDLSDLLAAFERICETVGFAHDRGVIHRDLKPSNVMLGAHGEVFVMDWGLARAVRDEGGGTRDDRKTLTPSGSSLVPRPSSLQETTVGAVKGTPAYMAPEQARGEDVDPRADVFALGGILTAILTGRPPFIGKTALDTVLKAARAELDECDARLDACGEDPALVAIARRALAPEPDDRYADGAEVAEAVADYRADVRGRLERAEQARAVADAEAREARKRRRVQRWLSAAVLLLVIGAAAVAVWQVSTRADRARKAEQEAAARKYEAERADRAAADALDLAARLRGQLKFAEAVRTLEQAAGATLVSPEWSGRLDDARRDTLFAQELDAIRYRKWEWATGAELAISYDEAAAPGRYADAFAARGWRPHAAEPVVVARQVKDATIRKELVAALEDWALFEPEPGVRKRLLEAARLADPHPWRDRFRDAAVWSDREALLELAATARPDTPPAARAALATVMARAGLDPTALLVAGRAAHPDDFGLAFALGLWYADRGAAARAVGPFEAACALRPDNLSARNNLATSYYASGDMVAAVAIYRENVRRDPMSAIAHNNLGTALYTLRDFTGAADAYRVVVRLNPESGLAHSHLGTALAEAGQFEAALASHARAIELAPRSVKCRTNLAVAYRFQGDYQKSLVAYRAAVALDPTDVFARNSFGLLWRAVGNHAAAIGEFKAALRLDPNHAHALGHLGDEYHQTGDTASAVATLLEAVRLAPNAASHYSNLGNALRDGGDIDGAVRAFQTAIRLDPNNAIAYSNLGNIYQRRGNHAAAVQAHRTAVARDPNFAVGYNNLGVALLGAGDAPGALAAFRRATTLAPKLAAAHFGVGAILEAQGDTLGAVAAFEGAARADPRNATAYARLTVLHLRAQRYDDAATNAERAVALVPTFAHGHALLGQARLGQGDLDGARAALVVADRLDPSKWTDALLKLPRFPVAPPPRPAENP